MHDQDPTACMFPLHGGVRAITLTCLFLAQLSAFACIWDYDTIAVERRRFPSTLELITGKFLRHSDDYYEWRINDRLARIEASPNEVNLYDDLAVSYDKLGRHALAIETIERKNAMHPGLYETYANLGTFHVHAGNFAEGLKYIDKAIEINPDAHFGREVVQKVLVEFLIFRREALDQIPAEEWSEGVGSAARTKTVAGIAISRLLADREEGAPVEEEPKLFIAPEALSFDRFLSMHEGPVEIGIAAGVEGVLGMMKFGDHRSVALLEALGDLVGTGDVYENSDWLAQMAYVTAQRLNSDEKVRSILKSKIGSYRERDGRSLFGTDYSIREMLDAGLEEAEAWFAEIVENERRWIAEGVDVDARYKEKYYDDPEIEVIDRPTILTPLANWISWNKEMVFTIVVIAVVVIVAWLVGRTIVLWLVRLARGEESRR